MAKEKKPEKKSKVPVLSIIFIIVGFGVFATGIALSTAISPSLIGIIPVGFFFFFLGVMLNTASRRAAQSRTTDSEKPVGDGNGYIAPDEGYMPEGTINDDRNRRFKASIVCPKCGHINNPGSRFCDQCGTALTKLCPKCGAENDPSDAFCSKCGQRLDEKVD